MIMDESQDGRRFTAYFISIRLKGPHPALWGRTCIRVTQVPKEQKGGTGQGDPGRGAALRQQHLRLLLLESKEGAVEYKAH